MRTDETCIRHFPEFLAAFERNERVLKCLKRLYTDLGGEYFPLKKTYSRIKFTATAGYTPEHNSIAELLNRSLKEPATAMLLESYLLLIFWCDAIQASTRLYNRMPHSGTSSTPYELLNGSRPSAKYWRPFGCRKTVTVPKAKRMELHPRVELRIILATLDHGV